MRPPPQRLRSSRPVGSHVDLGEMAALTEGRGRVHCRPLLCRGTAPFFPPKAAVCNQKAEVDEGADEGAETLPTEFFNDLQCFW
jgi:hypothetical protein